MRTIRGSMLLFSVGLIAVMVAVAFSFLATVRMMADESQSSQRRWLAESAALAGSHHAIERIIDSSGEPLTGLDGSWVAWAKPLSAIDSAQASNGTLPDADDDVRSENRLWQPLRGVVDYPDTMTLRPFETGAAYGENGRGRYFEVEWYDTTNTRSARFTDMASAAPSRNQGVWLDSQLRGIVPRSGESATSVRARTRFRMRYAVSVMDLSGHILINPVPDTGGAYNDYRDAWPPGASPVGHASVPGSVFTDAHYATYGPTFAPTLLGQRLERYRSAMYNMAAFVPNAGEQPGEAGRIEHVFMLRGNVSNVALSAKRPATAGSGGPVAFPTMIRRGTGTDQANKNELIDGTSGTNTGVVLYPNQDQVSQIQGGQPMLYGTGNGGNAFVDDTNNGIAATAFTHALVGPQYSWRNIMSAVTGEGHELLPFSKNFWPNGENSESQRFWLTPFGRGMSQEKAGDPKFYHYGVEGPTDTPWVVNLLTAPAAATNAMISGLMPPGLKWYVLTQRPLPVIAASGRASSSPRSATSGPWGGAAAPSRSMRAGRPSSAGPPPPGNACSRGPRPGPVRPSGQTTGAWIARSSSRAARP